jgi:hypothetical protein
MHPGPSCPSCPFSTESGNTEINTQIRGVLAHRADPNLGSSLVPLRERVDNPWVSLLGLALSYLCQSLFLNVCIPVQGLVHARSTPRGVSLLRMWRDRRPAVAAANYCGHGGKGDGWRATWSSRVHRSLTRRGYCLILWLWPTETSCIRFGLV